MARKDKQEPKAGALVRARQWFADRIAPARAIKEAETFLFGGSTTITSMLGSGRRAAREQASDQCGGHVAAADECDLHLGLHCKTGRIGAFAAHAQAAGSAHLTCRGCCVARAP